jgi:glycosyltransferase involved in cell wall biosynthesis
MNYPRVLIVGQYFDKKSGGGITLTNLFLGWDKKSIAVATKVAENIDFSVCENVYRLGDREITKGFPFNLKTNRGGKISGALIPAKHEDQICIEDFPVLDTKTRFKENLFRITGQIYRRQSLTVSEELLIWIKEFSPDVIYSQLSSYELIDLVNQLHLTLKTPIVIHIMDDWPSTITYPQKSIFRYYWSGVINKKIVELFSKASALLSISEAMSLEYQKRYGLDFVPFHNPIDIEKWIVHEKKYNFDGVFSILYAGRIGTGLQISLIEVAEAIEALNTTGFNIAFKIQATNFNPILLELQKYKCVVIIKPLSYDKLPGIFTQSDLLLLPNDFDKMSLSFLKFSMPTKASEYMVSGTPILVYSSIDSAITNHALKYKWAFVVSEQSKAKLIAAIQLLYENKELRFTLGTTAKELAINNFNSSKIRADFKNIIQIASKNHY